MIIDTQIEGLTCDIIGTFLDIYLDENNNSFSNIDNSSASTLANSITTAFNLPPATFAFKGNSFMQNIDSRLSGAVDENDSLNNMDRKLKAHQPLTKQSVKRALFVEKDEIDHEANLMHVRKQIEQLEKQDCEKWNFDFKNNRPLHSSNARYEWFVNEPVLNKLDLNAKSSSINSSVDTSNNKLSNSKCDKKVESSVDSPSNATDHIATRSLKRKLNINDYFQPTKKRTSGSISSKDESKSTDVLLPMKTSNNNLKYQNEIKDTVRSIKLQQQAQSQSSKQAPTKATLKRKCKKSRASSTQQQRRQKKLKSLEKVTTKRQTTLKF